MAGAGGRGDGGVGIERLRKFAANADQFPAIHALIRFQHAVWFVITLILLRRYAIIGAFNAFRLRRHALGFERYALRLKWDAFRLQRYGFRWRRFTGPA